MNGMTALNTAGFAHPQRNVNALNIEPGMTVVDFGAGSGAYVSAIAQRLANAGHVYAVDIQQDLLRRIKNDAHKNGHKNVEIIWSDLEKQNGSKIADRHADVVLISNLLFQVEDKRALLDEAWRILKPKGKLAIIDWSESFGGMGPQKKDVFQKHDAIAMATERGFELVGEFDAGAHHYGLLLRPVPRT
jgi:ubiquinone/menaquinone biosynthesis C-methylase UbiE